MDNFDFEISQQIKAQCSGLVGVSAYLKFRSVYERSALRAKDRQRIKNIVFHNKYENISKSRHTAVVDDFPQLNCGYRVLDASGGDPYPLLVHKF